MLQAMCAAVVLCNISQNVTVGHPLLQLRRVEAVLHGISGQDIEQAGGLYLESAVRLRRCCTSDCMRCGAAVLSRHIWLNQPAGLHLGRLDGSSSKGSVCKRGIRCVMKIGVTVEEASAAGIVCNNVQVPDGNVVEMGFSVFSFRV